MEILPKHRENREFGNFGQNKGNLEIWPKHREFGNFGQNTGNLEIWPKHREFGNFGQNTGNLEIWPKHRESTGILFAQVVNFLILKVKNIVIFAVKFALKKFDIPSKFCVRNSHKSRKLALGKFLVGQGKNKENTGI